MFNPSSSGFHPFGNPSVQHQQQHSGPPTTTGNLNSATTTGQQGIIGHSMSNSNNNGTMRKSLLDSLHQPNNTNNNSSVINSTNHVGMMNHHLNGFPNSSSGSLFYTNAPPNGGNNTLFNNSHFVRETPSLLNHSQPTTTNPLGNDSFQLLGNKLFSPPNNSNSNSNNTSNLSSNLLRNNMQPSSTTNNFGLSLLGANQASSNADTMRSGHVMSSNNNIPMGNTSNNMTNNKNTLSGLSNSNNSNQMNHLNNPTTTNSLLLSSFQNDFGSSFQQQHQQYNNPPSMTNNFNSWPTSSNNLGVGGNIPFGNNNLGNNFYSTHQPFLSMNQTTSPSSASMGGVQQSHHLPPPSLFGANNHGISNISSISGGGTNNDSFFSSSTTTGQFGVFNQQARDQSNVVIGGGGSRNKSEVDFSYLTSSLPLDDDDDSFLSNQTTTNPLFEESSGFQKAIQPPPTMFNHHPQQFPGLSPSSTTSSGNSIGTNDNTTAIPSPPPPQFLSSAPEYHNRVLAMTGGQHHHYNPSQHNPPTTNSNFGSSTMMNYNGFLPPPHVVIPPPHFNQHQQGSHRVNIQPSVAVLNSEGIINIMDQQQPIMEMKQIGNGYQYVFAPPPLPTHSQQHQNQQNQQNQQSVQITQTTSTTAQQQQAKKEVSSSEKNIVNLQPSPANNVATTLIRTTPTDHETRTTNKDQPIKSHQTDQGISNTTSTAATKKQEPTQSTTSQKSKSKKKNASKSSEVVKQPVVAASVVELPPPPKQVATTTTIKEEPPIKSEQEKLDEELAKKLQREFELEYLRNLEPTVQQHSKSKNNSFTTSGGKKKKASLEEIPDKLPLASSSTTTSNSFSLLESVVPSSETSEKTNKQQLKQQQQQPQTQPAATASVVATKSSSSKKNKKKKNEQPTPPQPSTTTTSSKKEEKIEVLVQKSSIESKQPSTIKEEDYNKPCKDHFKGKCKFGSGICPYSHDRSFYIKYQQEHPDELPPLTTPKSKKKDTADSRSSVEIISPPEPPSPHKKTEVCLKHSSIQSCTNGKNCKYIHMSDLSLHDRYRKCCTGHSDRICKCSPQNDPPLLYIEGVTKLTKKQMQEINEKSFMKALGVFKMAEQDLYQHLPELKSIPSAERKHKRFLFIFPDTCVKFIISKIERSEANRVKKLFNETEEEDCRKRSAELAGQRFDNEKDDELYPTWQIIGLPSHQHCILRLVETMLPLCFAVPDYDNYVEGEPFDDAMYGHVFDSYDARLYPSITERIFEMIDPDNNESDEDLSKEILTMMLGKACEKKNPPTSVSSAQRTVLEKVQAYIESIRYIPIKLINFDAIKN